MRKRNCRVEVCFTKDELYDLTKKARKAHLSIGGFIRHAVRGIEVKEAPPADVPMLIREVRRVGYNIDQILKLANAKGLLDVPQHDIMDSLANVGKQTLNDLATGTGISGGGTP